MLLLLLALPLALQAQSPAAIRDLDAYIQKTLTDWEGAGLAIAVVKDDSVVFAKGYGVREMGKADPVTPRTLFAIGSNTKLFTAVVAGIAVDEGKLHWGDKVTMYLPWFQLYDPFASREITVRDMLSHNSGLGRRGDQLWYGTVYNRQEILRRVRYLPPSRQLSLRVRLLEHHGARRRRGDGGGDGHVVGRSHSHAHLRSARHDLVEHDGARPQARAGRRDAA